MVKRTQSIEGKNPIFFCLFTSWLVPPINVYLLKLPDCFRSLVVLKWWIAHRWVLQTSGVSMGSVWYQHSCFLPFPGLFWLFPFPCNVRITTRIKESNNFNILLINYSFPTSFTNPPLLPSLLSSNGHSFSSLLRVVYTSQQTKA